MQNERPLDLVLFGATGFTGGLVLSYLGQHADGPKLRWGVAGRSASKLAQAVAAHAGVTWPPQEQILADSMDEASLRAMARRTRVVITTVGPYARYGELLVKVCAEEGTDYVDLTGEPEFVHAVRARYHEAAQASGARIVHACGFDSIPHDLGAHFTLQRLLARLPGERRGRTPITIEGFVRARGSASGGTWHSAVHAMSQMTKPNAQRGPKNAKLDDRRVRPVTPSIRYRRELGLWAVPMPTIDPQIVLRSARALPEYGADFRYGHYLALRHLHEVAGLLVGVSGVFMLAQLPVTRALLLRARDPGEGPDEATRARSWFSVTFLGRAGDEAVRCEVRGGDPGYGETAKMLSESALCLAFDRDRLTTHTGIVTTAEVMADPLRERLMRAGISFAEN